MALLEETLEIIERVEQETGKPLEYRADDSLAVEGQWSYKGSHHLITYHPRWEPFLDHTIAHEAGHIFRLWEEHPEKFYLPAWTPKTRRKALRDLEPDYMELVQRGLPSAVIRETFDTIYHRNPSTILRHLG